MPLLIAAGVANVITSATIQVAVAEIAPHPNGLVASLIANSPKIVSHHADISWLAILVGSSVNAYFEELVFMGYAFQQFAAKRNPLFALLAMVFLRMLLHTYKGPVGMVGIGAFSFVYGLAYLKLRRLWPLILGHNLTDIAAFTALKLLFGR